MTLPSRTPGEVAKIITGKEDVEGETLSLKEILTSFGVSATGRNLARTEEIMNGLATGYKELFNDALRSTRKEGRILKVEVTPLKGDIGLFSVGSYDKSVFLVAPARATVVRELPSGSKRRSVVGGTFFASFYEPVKKVMDFVFHPGLRVSGRGVEELIRKNRRKIRRIDSVYDVVALSKLAWKGGLPAFMNFPFVSGKFGVGVFTVGASTITSEPGIVSLFTEHSIMPLGTIPLGVCFGKGIEKISLMTSRGDNYPTLTVHSRGLEFEFALFKELRPFEVENYLRFGTWYGLEKVFVSGSGGVLQRGRDAGSGCILLSSVNSEGKLCIGRVNKPYRKISAKAMLRKVDVQAVEFDAVNLFRVEGVAVAVTPLKVIENKEAGNATVTYFVTVARVVDINSGRVEVASELRTSRYRV